MKLLVWLLLPRLGQAALGVGRQVDVRAAGAGVGRRQRRRRRGPRAPGGPENNRRYKGMCVEC